MQSVLVSLRRYIMQDLNALIDEYAGWCAAQGLLQIDAMEQVLDPAISDDQRRWLSDFILRWEAAERAQGETAE